MLLFRSVRILTGGTVVAMASCGCGTATSAVVQLGCHQYCQQAGVPQGAPSSGGLAVKIITTGTVVPLSDGAVPIAVTCHAAFRCEGALVLQLTNAEIGEIPGLSNPVPATEAKLSEGDAGQADLVVGAQSTRKLGIELVPKVRQLLRLRGPLKMDALAETGRDYVVSDRASIVLSSTANEEHASLNPDARVPSWANPEAAPSRIGTVADASC
jgi:hypothetical protein